jgi:hypothetical protein
MALAQEQTWRPVELNWCEFTQLCPPGRDFKALPCPFRYARSQWDSHLWTKEQALDSAGDFIRAFQGFRTVRSFSCYLLYFITAVYEVLW